MSNRAMIDDCRPVPTVTIPRTLDASYLSVFVGAILQQYPEARFRYGVGDNTVVEFLAVDTVARSVAEDFARVAAERGDQMLKLRQSANERLNEYRELAKENRKLAARVRELESILVTTKKAIDEAVEVMG